MLDKNTKNLGVHKCVHEVVFFFMKGFQCLQALVLAFLAIFDVSV